MVGHGGSSASSYLTDPTSPIPSHCASIVATSTLRVKQYIVAHIWITMHWMKQINEKHPFSYQFSTQTLHVHVCSWWLYLYQCLFVSSQLYYEITQIGDGDLFIGPQEFVVGYSKAPEHPQSSARPTCHSHAMTSTGREPATISIAA